jgi:hypothetical protein
MSCGAVSSAMAAAAALWWWPWGISFDGSWIAFTTAASNLGVRANNYLMVNRSTGQVLPLSAVASGSVGSAPVVSRSGAYVVFASSGPLDPRFPGAAGGLYARFTDLDRAFWWA